MSEFACAEDFRHLGEVEALSESAAMAYFPRPHTSLRAPRVRMSEPPRIVFTVDGTNVQAILHKLSITGGCARMSRQCAPGSLAELKINTDIGRLEALVEMLPPEPPGNEQAFRFVAMGDADQELLASTVSRLRRRGYGEGKVHEGF